MKGVFLFIAVVSVHLYTVAAECSFSPPAYLPSLRTTHPFGYWLCDGLTTIFEDAFDLHCNLFSMTTLKIGVATVPLYLIARLSDRHVHQQFYDATDHTNKKQLPTTVTKVFEKGGDAGIILLSSLALFANDPCLRTTGRVFAIGAASALIAKDIIKTFQTNAALRPWNQYFSKEQRAYGGFPSGHMIEATYMLTVWGLGYGWAAAVPLGLFAAGMFGVLVNSNRHYASQVVAGAGLGAAYGFAAHKVIHNRLPDCCCYIQQIEKGNGWMAGIRYAF
jgi:membrane-associated phospholipid phosphatase